MQISRHLVFVSSLFAPALLLSGCGGQGKAAEPTEGMQLAAGQTEKSKKDKERAEKTAKQSERAARELAEARCKAVQSCEKSRQRPNTVWPLAEHDYCMNVMRQEAQEIVDACGAKGVNAKNAETCSKTWSAFDDCKKVDKPIGTVRECSLDVLCNQ